MENWGLVTYREVALLVDPKMSSTKVKERVALTVAHELAHLWFGDLVTMVSFSQLLFLYVSKIDNFHQNYKVSVRITTNKMVKRDLCCLPSF